MKWHKWKIRIVADRESVASVYMTTCSHNAVSWERNSIIRSPMYHARRQCKAARSTFCHRLLALINILSHLPITKEFTCFTNTEPVHWVYSPIPLLLQTGSVHGSSIEKNLTATRSCRTRKRAFHFYSPGVVRRSHAVARQVRALLYVYSSVGAAAAVAAAAATGAAVYRQFDD